MEPFSVDIAERDGNTVVRVEGDVDLGTAPRLRQALMDLVATGHDHIVLDLTATEFLDSTGLGAIVAAVKRLRARHGEMRVACSTPRVCKVFEMSRVNRVLPLFPTVDDALAV